jgi:transcriptional regulator with XRE-family HTH domain
MLLMGKRKPETPKPRPTAFGVRLQSLRLAAGMTQLELGEATGIGRGALAKLEVSPSANPTIETVRKLAVALGCTPNDLIPLDESPG